MISELEDYYGKNDFSILVIYHLDPNFLNDKSQEEYGGWTVGLKMPNHPEVIFRHFDGVDIYR